MGPETTLLAAFHCSSDGAKGRLIRVAEYTRSALPGAFVAKLESAEKMTTAPTDHVSQ